MSLLPREHGAYGQLAFPLVTAWAVAGVSGASLSLGAAVVAGFLAHEPILVLLGRRGPRTRREGGRRAAVWLMAAGAVLLSSGLLGLWLAPPPARAALVLPLVPAAVLAAMLLAGREKSLAGETAAALAFSGAAVPIALAAGASAGTALAIALTFASIFVTGTLAVRVIILKVRAGGDPSATRATRILVLAVAAAAAGGLSAAGAQGALPWAALAGAAPGLVAAAVVALRTPAPARLRRVGWTLVSASTAAAIILIAAL